MAATSGKVESVEISMFLPELDDSQCRALMAKMARTLRQVAAIPEIGKFRRNLRLPAEAKQLSHRALKLYDHYLLQAVGHLQKKGWQLSCAGGCAACCFSMPAGVSSWELLLIYDHLLASGQLERFFRRNLESCQVLSRVKSAFAEKAVDVNSGEEAASDSLLQCYCRARQPCAFLSDLGECYIYPVRPLACRMHFGFSPPEWCDPAHPNFPQAVRLNFHPHQEVREALDQLLETLGLNVDELLSPGLVTLTANIMRFAPLF